MGRSDEDKAEDGEQRKTGKHGESERLGIGGVEGRVCSLYEQRKNGPWRTTFYTAEASNAQPTFTVKATGAGMSRLILVEGF